MDKGAHFFKVDFQIHSPRDSNWGGGARPQTPDERLAYAQAFVGRCREIGVNAIAITDHHDIEFIKYFQYAAMDGTEPFPGKLDIIDPTRQNPVVFPGIELTLSVPCQAIVLLDPECTEDIQAALLNVLGKHPYNPNDPIGPQVDRLSHDNFFRLNELLFSHNVLQGRYIILPNVNDRGEDTCLRVGYHEKYAMMPCVGAFVDGFLHNHQKLHILEGKDHNWGNKAVGVFQTSDHRASIKEYTGSICTWVKIGALTTEALRQACLGWQSRIRQAEPQLPGIYIQRMHVSDSIFLGPTDIELNQQFNALIGGRGTGKTSILEYLRYAMQDQPPQDPDDESVHDEIDRKRSRIIETLSGSITIDWMKNSVPHCVTFDPAVGKLALKVGKEEAVDVTPDQLRAILPLQAYSQKQLSTVGTRTRELQRFVEQPIQGTLTRCNNAIGEKRHELEAIYDRLTAMNEKNRAVSALKTELRSVQEQAKTAEDSLPQLSADLQKAIKEHPLRLREEQAIAGLETDIASAREALDEVQKTLSSLPREVTVEDESPQQQTVLSIQGLVSTMLQKVRDAISIQQKSLVEEEKTLGQQVAVWEKDNDAHKRIYENAQNEAKEHRQKLDLIKQLRTQEAAIQKQVAELASQISVLQAMSAEFDEGWRTWVSIHRERGDSLDIACKTLTEKSGGEIEAELLRGADFGKAMGFLKDALKGCNIREANWAELEEFFEQENPAINWMQLMEQLRPLAEMTKEEIPADGNVPSILCWPSLTPAMRQKIVERLSPPRRWLDIALTSLEDLPVFYYRPKDGDRIKFENASAGQQATALLKVLLKETTGPLVIDQPEDDLDNVTIQQIAEEIWAAKERRQIIFSSHNANIVVNGDAELVVHCDYREVGDRTKGHVAGEGAIDIPAIREAIKRVMEGGDKAFQLRRQKYGF